MWLSALVEEQFVRRAHVPGPLRNAQFPRSHVGLINIRPCLLIIPDGRYGVITANVFVHSRNVFCGA